jgi:predicted aspartyl protease
VCFSFTTNQFPSGGLFPTASFRLSLLYSQGKGVPQNQEIAQSYLQKSALHGFKPTGDMTAETQAAQKESKEWLTKPAGFQPAVSDPKTPATPPRARKGDSETADMVRENGVLKVPVQINGAITLKFVVDSGASEVLIPKDVFLTLIRAETIKESDFLPGKTFVLADGSKVKSDRFILRSIKVGESTFADVEASVGGLDASLLLGQSFLLKFDEWRIDNKNAKLILTK